jgi:hypothetical protein
MLHLKRATATDVGQEWPRKPVVEYQVATRPDGTIELTGR